MSRTLVGAILGFVIAFAPASGASAKERPTALELCGVKSCAEVLPLHDWGLPAWLTPQANAGVGPAAPAPFYVVKVAYAGDESSRIAYYVPAAGRLKLNGGGVVGVGAAIWGRIDAADNERLLAASAGLAPFPAPRVSWANVGTRQVKKPARYLRLYSVQGPPASDPAGPPPTVQYASDNQEAWYAAWSPYFQRVRQEWIRVQIGTRTTSPWGYPESFVWIGRRSDILKRDGEVIRIPTSLAQRLRKGFSF